MTSTPLSSTDRPRTMAYDAAGRLVSSVETGALSTSTYTAAYDGDGQMVYESSTTSPGTSESSYLVRSSVLGGELLTRLDQSGNKKITYVPAEGLLFATQRASGGPGPFVLATYRNPLGITETSRALYDPLGNYIPFQGQSDPRPPAGSYSSASMSGLSSSQANAESYGVGCIADGMPTNCKKVMEHLERGRAKKLEVLGLATTAFITRLMMSLTPIGSASVSVGPRKLIWAGELRNGKGIKVYHDVVQLWTLYLLAPGMQGGFEQNPTGAQQQDTVTDNPPSIDNSKAKNQACQIEVSFSGSGSRGLQNGPSTMNLNNRGQVFGIGFTVKISGLSGPINIVSEAKDRRQTSAWNVEQYVADFNKSNGVVVRQDGGARLEELRRAAPVVDGGTVEWWDHPGTAVSGNSQYFTKRNFYIKAYKGKQHCEVSFHLTFRLFFGKPQDIGWGDGPYP